VLIMSLLLAGLHFNHWNKQDGHSFY
jgi:hypothetical protein